MEDNKHYLLFSLQKELFGLNVNHVIRVVNLEKIIKIPKAPTFVVGAVNLEGEIIPLLDLAEKIELGTTDRRTDSKVVILEIQRGDESIKIGILIDEVLDVIPVNEANISAPPLDNTGFDTNILEGMYKEEEDFYMIIGASKIFENELELLVQ